MFDTLNRLKEDHPYLLRKEHPNARRVEMVWQCLQEQNIPEAKEHLKRIQTAIKVDDKGLKAAFKKFDLNNSGDLEVEEFKHFVTYVGFSPTVVAMLLEKTDGDQNGVVSLKEFQDFVGRMGGINTLFERRREAVAKKGDRSAARIPVGSRVRAYHYEGKQKSDTVWDARVVEVSAFGDTAKLEFSLDGNSAEAQEVPIEWIQEDVDLIQALSSLGIFEDAQHYWTILLPASEQYVAQSLTPCQSQAIYETRRQATENHNKAVIKLLQRGSSIGISNGELWSVLTWVRDLAPIIIHLDLDAVVKFLEEDTHYRNQFETHTSKGLLIPQKREEWEQKLFGGSYDEAEPFQRPKYGVLDVMNDHRGVMCARDYGDSYMMLQNARLRCTFSPVDSGGICGDRLAVLDQYAHVLMEFSDDELKEVSRVANAKEGSQDRIGDSTKLEGFNYKEAQIHGEVDLKKHVKRLVVHPRHMVDGSDEMQIRKACNKHGWEFQWMHEERKRRIWEERQTHDDFLLERSWRSEEVVSMPKGFLNETNRRTNNRIETPPAFQRLTTN